jgi:CRP-like cAMP-binding protein
MGDVTSEDDVTPLPNFNEYLQILEKVPICNVLTKRQKTELVKCLKMRSFATGEYILRQTEEGNAFYIILSGTVIITRRINPDNMFEKPTIEGKLYEHQYFGEIALLVRRNRTANCVALGEVK